MTTPDSLDWARSQAFVDNGRELASVLNHTPTGYSVGPLDVSRYQSVGLSVGWHGSTTPQAYDIELVWQESNVTVWADNLSAWNAAAVGNSQYGAYFQVPCRGSSLTVDTGSGPSGDQQNLLLIGSGRAIPQLRAQADATHDGGAGAFYSNSSLGAGATEQIYIGPCSGPYRWTVQAGAQNTLFDLYGLLNNSGTVTKMPLQQVQLNNSNTYYAPIYLPGCAVEVDVTNNGTAAVAYNWQLIPGAL